MSCDVGKATELLENQLWALLILQPLHHFTYITVHSPTIPLLYLRHSSFSNPSVASPTSQLILQLFFHFSYVTGSSLMSPGESPMSQFTGVTVDLPARRNSSRLCQHGKWCAWCSGTNRAFSLPTSWLEVRGWMLSVTANHCRNCDGPFRISGAGCLVPVLSCCMIMLSHTWFNGQHISCRSPVGRCLTRIVPSANSVATSRSANTRHW